MTELKKARHSAGLSQMRLSQIAKVSRYRIHLFENKYVQLSKLELVRIKTAIKLWCSELRKKI